MKPQSAFFEQLGADGVAAFTQKDDPLQGALINSSRGISFAYRQRLGVGWKIAARDALNELAESVRSALA